MSPGLYLPGAALARIPPGPAYLAAAGASKALAAAGAAGASASAFTSSAPSGQHGLTLLAASACLWFGAFHVGLNSTHGPAATFNPQRERLDNHEKTSCRFGQPPCI